MLFSDRWHDLGAQRAWLRPQITAHRQFFRGDLSYVLADPYSNQFYRVSPAAWDFLGRLDGRSTVDDLWRARVAAEPATTPSQVEVVQLLAALSARGLLLSDRPLEAERLDDQHRETRARKFRSQAANFLFLRIPLWNPDRWLRAMRPLDRAIFSPVGAGVWLAVGLAGLIVAAGHARALLDQTQGVLAPGNLVALYATWAAVKLAHELGHAFACRHYGGEVPSLGLMLLVFTPVPYCDTTSAWRLRRRHQRVLVGAAGMIVELFIAALAVMVWAATGRDSAINQIAYNIVFLASVGTLLFNLNPLLRFDGYYILGDLLGVANLHQRSIYQLRHLLERYVFGLRKSQGPARTRRDAAIYVGFGLASGVYRIFVFAVIILFIADQFLGLGLILAAGALAAFFVSPVVKFTRYLLREPRLEPVRPRALWVSSATALILILFFAAVPWPRHFRAPAVVQMPGTLTLATSGDGYLREVLVASGQAVRAGEPLARLENPALDQSLRATGAQIQELDARLRAARGTEPALLEPLARTRAALEQRRADLDARRAALLVRAPADGLWSAPYLAQNTGAWLPRGAALGLLVSRQTPFVAAAVPQTDAASLFGAGLRAVEIRFPGRSGTDLAAPSWQIIAVERQRLRSPALGWQAGGALSVDRHDHTGETTVEPYFEVRLPLDPATAAPLLPALRHDQTAVVRFTLPPQPLAGQLWRAFRQLIQQRYRL